MEFSEVPELQEVSQELISSDNIPNVGYSSNDLKQGDVLSAMAGVVVDTTYGDQENPIESYNNNINLTEAQRDSKAGQYLVGSLMDYVDESGTYKESLDLGMKIHEDAGKVGISVYPISSIVALISSNCSSHSS